MNGNSFLIHTALATAQCTGRVKFCWLELTDKPVGAWARESLRRISIEILFREMLRLLDSRRTSTVKLCEVGIDKRMRSTWWPRRNTWSNENWNKDDKDRIVKMIHKDTKMETKIKYFILVNNRKIAVESLKSPQLQIYDFLS